MWTHVNSTGILKLQPSKLTFNRCHSGGKLWSLPGDEFSTCSFLLDRWRTGDASLVEIGTVYKNPDVLVSRARLSRWERVWSISHHHLVSNTPRISWRVNWVSDEWRRAVAFFGMLFRETCVCVRTRACVRARMCVVRVCLWVRVRACVCVLHSINKRVVWVVLAYGGYGGAREGGGLLWFSKNNIGEDICIVQVHFSA